MYPPAKVPVCVSLLVTIIFFAPAVEAGNVQLIEVRLATEGDVQAVPPIVTVAAVINPVRVNVIEVNPLNALAQGEALVTAGAA